MDINAMELLNDPDFQPVWNKLYEQMGRKAGTEFAKQMDFSNVDSNMFDYYMKGFTDSLREACMLEHISK